MGRIGNVYILLHALHFILIIIFQYNAQPVEVNLDGHYLKFLPKVPFHFLEKIHAPGSLQPYEFMIIQLPLYAEQHITHVALVDPSQEHIIDVFSFGGIVGEPGGSYCRFPDGGYWNERLSLNPTPVGYTSTSQYFFMIFTDLFEKYRESLTLVYNDKLRERRVVLRSMYSMWDRGILN